MSTLDLANVIVFQNGEGNPPPPAVTAEVELVLGSECQYQFTFTVESATGNAVTDGRLDFTLVSGFGNPTNINPNNGTLEYTAPNGTWEFGNLNPGTPKTITFNSVYAGPANETIFDGDLIIYYVVGAKTYTSTIIAPDTQTANECPVTPPVDTTCCESCNTGFVEIPITSACDDYVEEEVTPSIDSFGRRLAINLTMPSACQSKDILVGVFVTELQSDGVTETPFAHKIIRLPANSSSAGCAVTRSCSCVNFLIDDDTTSGCTTRTFRVRTLAHYADTDPVQTCQCDTCTP